MQQILQQKIKNASQEDIEQWFKDNGYIKTKAFGWEKEEVLKKFNLNPEAEGIPCVEYETYEFYMDKVKVLDGFGNDTGQTRVEKKKKFTGKKAIGVAQNYIEYREYKDKLGRQRIAEKYNQPPLPDHEY